MKFIFPFLFFIGSTTTLISQSITQQVIASASAYQDVSGQANLHWTLGEPISKQIENEMHLTQGFIQIFDLISTAIKSPTSEFSIKVYPNPTTERLFINNETVSKIHLQLFNLNGQLLLDLPSWDKTESIDLSKYQSGFYLLKASNQEGAIRSFKIEKIN